MQDINEILRQKTTSAQSIASFKRLLFIKSKKTRKDGKVILEFSALDFAILFAGKQGAKKSSNRKP